MWLLTIHCSFRLSPVLLLGDISGIPCLQLTMFPTLNTCKTMAAGAFPTCTNLETGSKLPEFSGIAASARANQYRMKVPSWFRRLILNNHCSCHGRRHSERHNTSPGVALPTHSRSDNPLRASSGILCVDRSEICVHLLNHQVEP